LAGETLTTLGSTIRAMTNSATKSLRYRLLLRSSLNLAHRYAAKNLRCGFAD